MASVLTQKLANNAITTDVAQAITIDSGVNVGLVVITVADCTTSSAERVIDEINLSGQPMYFIGADNDDDNSAVSTFAMYFLPNIPAGNYTLNINRETTGNALAYYAIQITELEGLFPIDNIKRINSTGTNSPDADLSITNSSFVLSAVAVDITSSTATAGTGWTIGNSGTVLANTEGDIIYCYKDYTGSAPTTTTNAEMTITGTGVGTYWKVITVAIKTNAVQNGTQYVKTILSKNVEASKRRYRA